MYYRTVSFLGQNLLNIPEPTMRFYLVHQNFWVAFTLENRTAYFL